MEETLGRWGSQQGRYLATATALAEDGDVTCVTAEVSDILFNPLKSGHQVEQAHIARSRIFLTESGEIQKSKYIQAVVERNHYYVALAGQVGAIVTGQFLTATGRITATVQPNHDGALLAILDARGPDVHAQAILTRESIIPAVGKGHPVVGPTLTGTLWTGGTIGTAAANALPAVGSRRRHEAFGLGVRDTFIYIEAILCVTGYLTLLGGSDSCL